MTLTLTQLTQASFLQKKSNVAKWFFDGMKIVTIYVHISHGDNRAFLSYAGGFHLSTPFDLPFHLPVQF